jgi:hypothetical protein
MWWMGSRVRPKLGVVLYIFGRLGEEGEEEEEGEKYDGGEIGGK